MSPLFSFNKQLFKPFTC